MDGRGFLIGVSLEATSASADKATAGATRGISRSGFAATGWFATTPVASSSMSRAPEAGLVAAFPSFVSLISFICGSMSSPSRARWTKCSHPVLARS